MTGVVHLLVCSWRLSGLTIDAGNSLSGRTESQGVILSSGMGQTTGLAIDSPSPISLPQPLKNADSLRKTQLWGNLMERSFRELSVSCLESCSTEI